MNQIKQIALLTGLIVASALSAEAASQRGPQVKFASDIQHQTDAAMAGKETTAASEKLEAVRAKSHRFLERRT